MATVLASPGAATVSRSARLFERGRADQSARKNSAASLTAGRAPRLPAMHDIDLLVDLGAQVFSAHWWRGAATLAVLSASALSLGSSLPSSQEVAPLPTDPAIVAEQGHDVIHSMAHQSRMGLGAEPVPTTRVRPLSEAPERPRVELESQIGAGGLGGSLRRSGVGREDINILEQLLKGRMALGSGMPGTPVELVLGRRAQKSDPRPLDHLKFRAAFDMKMEVSRVDGELRLKPIPIKVDHTPLRVTGEVGRSLAQSARAAGLPQPAVTELVREVSQVLDLRRDVRGRDRFDIIIAHKRAETGETEPGRLLYASLGQGNKQTEIMRWGAKGQFFRGNGESARQGQMRAPIPGRVGSGYGMRFHPVLGISRMHQGVDIPAVTGTPVRAVASGRIVRAGWGGGYGNLIEVDHGQGLRTRYAHLSKILIKNGQRVEPGQLIGHVGSTGLSTGPHLHYEVWRNGKAVNPRLPQFQPGPQLGGQELASFKAQMAQLKRSTPTA